MNIYDYQYQEVQSYSNIATSYGGGVLFPWRLHEMLEAAESRGFSSVVSWLPDRRSFKVHDKETFVSLIMSRYFEQTKYKSFQRQLNMWGFERFLSGAAKGGYTHPLFIRGQPNLCCRMSRLKKKKEGKEESKTTKTKSVKPCGDMQDKKVLLMVPDSPTKTSSPSSLSTIEDELPELPLITALNTQCSVVSHDGQSLPVAGHLIQELIISEEQHPQHQRVQEPQCPRQELVVQAEQELSPICSSLKQGNAMGSLFSFLIPEWQQQIEHLVVVDDDLEKDFAEFEGRHFFPVGSGDGMTGNNL